MNTNIILLIFIIYFLVLLIISRITSSKSKFGDFFNGSKFSIGNNFKYRVQPYFNASLKINFDSI